METKSESFKQAGNVAIFGKISDDDAYKRLVWPKKWLFRESTSVEGLVSLIYMNNDREINGIRFGLTDKGWVHMNTPVPAEIKPTEANAEKYKDQLVDTALEWLSQNRQITLDKSDFVQPKVSKEQSQAKIYSQYTSEEIIKDDKSQPYASL